MNQFTLDQFSRKTRRMWELKVYLVEYDVLDLVHPAARDRVDGRQEQDLEDLRDSNEDLAAGRMDAVIARVYSPPDGSQSRRGNGTRERERESTRNWRRCGTSSSRSARTPPRRSGSRAPSSAPRTR